MKQKLAIFAAPLIAFVAIFVAASGSSTASANSACTQYTATYTNGQPIVFVPPSGASDPIVISVVEGAAVGPNIGEQFSWGPNSASIRVCSASGSDSDGTKWSSTSNEGFHNTAMGASVSTAVITAEDISNSTTTTTQVTTAPPTTTPVTTAPPTTTPVTTAPPTTTPVTTAPPTTTPVTTAPPTTVRPPSTTTPHEVGHTGGRTGGSLPGAWIVLAILGLSIVISLIAMSKRRRA
jgi:hypothetical protein